MIDEIENLICAELGIKLEDTSRPLRYQDTPEWDSAAHMMIIIAIEERYSVVFESEEIPDLISASAIKLALEKR